MSRDRPFRVIRVGLTGPQRLPVYPAERTFPPARADIVRPAGKGPDRGGAKVNGSVQFYRNLEYGALDLNSSDRWLRKNSLTRLRLSAAASGL